MTLPIDRELLIKRSQIPSLISELSYVDEQQAVFYLRLWGEKKVPVSTLHDDLKKTLENLTA